MGFPAFPLLVANNKASFQSLIGFYGFSGSNLVRQPRKLLVSIPDRVLWVFRPLAFQTVAVFSIQGSFASAQTKNTISASVCQYPTLTCRLKLLLDKGFSNCVCLLFPVGASNPYSSWITAEKLNPSIFTATNRRTFKQKRLFPLTPQLP